MNETEPLILATNALKSIARSEQAKQYIKNDEELYPLLFRAAQRFIAGEHREDAISDALTLLSKGYSVSLECIGENIRDEQQCIEEKDEFIELIRLAGNNGLDATVSLDLSHIGMMIDEDLAYNHLVDLSREAALHGMTLMIGAEESAKTDQIHALYKRISESYPNVGITLQAYLNRTERDLEQIKQYPGRIRLVKGAYQEPSEIALPRSEQLRAKYVQLAERLMATDLPVSFATHDEDLIEAIRHCGYLDRPNVELEMLYGVRPDLLKKMKYEGYRAKAYITYGKEWHLYFFHRLAEYPPNMFRAIADIVTPSIKVEIY